MPIRRLSTLPKKEEDYAEVEREIHEHEPEIAHGHEHVHEHGHEHEHVEYESGEDFTTLILNAIAHSMTHIQADINSLNMEVRNLNEKLDNMTNMIKALVTVLLAQNVSDEKLRKDLLAQAISLIS